MGEKSPHCKVCATKLWKNSKAGSGRQRWTCRICKTRTTNPDQEPEEKVKFSSKIPNAKTYIFTAAQNATPIHKGFMASLIKFAEYYKAELIIIPFRYRNPTSQWTADNETHEWWATEVLPFLYAGRFNINKSLTILADIKVQPTAVSPLTGLESITGERSGIVAHTKIQLTTIPTPQNKLPKIMATTGACTVRNYSDTKTGKKGEFHHTLGAALVEVTRNGFHLRQINGCDDGSFIDVDIEATPAGAKKAPPAEALIMGDTHVDFVDPAVVAATFTDKNSMVKVLKPKLLIWHDLNDFYSRNHHHRNDPISAFVKHQSGMGDVKAEVIRACKFVDKYTPKGTESVLVPSNHPEAMARWLKETDWRFDPENADFYLETALAVVRSAKMTATGASSIDPFLYWAEKLLKKPATLLKRDDSYTVKGIECGMHGDKGANGARGNIKTFAKIGVKSIVGHTHSPGIHDGCYQTGTSTRLNLEYTSGPSSWLQTHCVIYANGKRSLISVIKGKWRA